MHKMAPSRSRALLPSYSGRSIQPGTANTSLPWFMALAAVFRLPLCRGASTTRVPNVRPLMIRLRCRKK